MPEDAHTLDNAIRQFAIAAARERAAFAEAIDAAGNREPYAADARTAALDEKKNCDRAARLVRDIDNRLSNLTPALAPVSPYVRELQSIRDEWFRGGELRLVDKARNPDGTVGTHGPNWPEEA